MARTRGAAAAQASLPSTAPSQPPDPPMEVDHMNVTLNDALRNSTHQEASREPEVHALKQGEGPDPPGAPDPSLTTLEQQLAWWKQECQKWRRLALAGKPGVQGEKKREVVEGLREVVYSLCGSAANLCHPKTTAYAMWSAAFIGYQLPSDNEKSGWNAYVSAQKQKLDAGEFSDPESWESSSESELADLADDTPRMAAAKAVRKNARFIKKVARKWSQMDQEEKDEIKAGAKEQLTAIKRARVGDLKPVAAENRVKGHARGINAAVTAMTHHDVESITFIVPNYECDMPGYDGQIIFSSDILMKQFAFHLCKDEGAEENEVLKAIKKDFHRNLKDVLVPQLAAAEPELGITTLSTLADFQQACGSKIWKSLSELIKGTKDLTNAPWAKMYDVCVKHRIGYSASIPPDFCWIAFQKREPPLFYRLDPKARAEDLQLLKELAASARAYKAAKEALDKNPPLDVLWPKFKALRTKEYDDLVDETDSDKVNLIK